MASCPCLHAVGELADGRRQELPLLHGIARCAQQRLVLQFIARNALGALRKQEAARHLPLRIDDDVQTQRHRWQ